jgi:hypothetical protein
MLEPEKRATFDSVSIHVFDGENEVRAFPWGTGDWKLDLKDTRMPRQADTRDVTTQTPSGRPRITSLDSKGSDQDRDLLGLPPDPAADPVLLVNTRDIGSLALHYGTLDLHHVPVSDEWARGLIHEAVNRGFEVRRRIHSSVAKGGGAVVRTAIDTSITTRRAANTPEIER